MNHILRRRIVPALVFLLLGSMALVQTHVPMTDNGTNTHGLSAQTTYETTITVTSTDDSDVSKAHTCYTTPGVGQTAFPGECTLRRAIIEASSLPESDRPVLIDFDIPTTDDGYDATQGIWRIVVNNTGATNADLPPIEGGQVTIDGTTQTGGRSEGPNIFITANYLETVASPSLRLRLGEIAGDDGYTVRGLGLQGFGISMVGSDNLVEQNWLGLTDDGERIWFYRGENPLFVTRTRTATGAYVTTPVVDNAYFFEGDPEKGNGAEIVDRKAGSNNIIRDNVLAGTNGIAIDISSTDSQVTGNFVGSRADGTIPDRDDHRTCKPNALYYNWFGGSGIKLTGDATNVVVSDNVIVGMLKYSKDVKNTPVDALAVYGNGNTVEDNRIGVDANDKAVGVCGQGLDMGGHNQTIRNNTLVDTRGGAFGIYGSADILDAIHLTGNTTRLSYLGMEPNIPSNPYFGQTVPNAYKQFNSAAITSLDGTAVEGTAGADSPCAGCAIELYSDNADNQIEALELLATTTADAEGNWEATLSRELADGEGIRTATTTADNAQISGIDAPTTAKFSDLYGPSGVITPTQWVTPTFAIEQPPVFPNLAPRAVPAFPDPTYATTIVVNTTSDENPNQSTICTGNATCTFRHAINEVRTLSTEPDAHPILISFDIPESDSGYDATNDVWKITMSSTADLRVEGGQITIDGTTQPGGRSDGPKIIMTDERDLVLDGSDNAVRGVAFQGMGLKVNGSYTFIEDNWFGFSDDGQEIFYPNDDPSRDNHASIQDTESSVGTPAMENVYRNNRMAGTIATAMTIRSDSSWVVGNIIGALPDGTVPTDLDADWCETGAWYGGAGITIQGMGTQVGGPNDGDRNFLVGLNYPTSPTADPPIAINLEGQGGTLVLNNVLGQDTSGTQSGNCGEGIRFSDDFSVAQDNTIVRQARGAFKQVSPRLGGNRNLMTDNTLIGNAAAMSYSDAVEKELDLFGFNPARVMSIDGTAVEGQSGNDYVDPITGYVVKGFCPFCIIEIFADNDDATTDALELLATTTSDADGNWEATLSRTLADGEGIRTTSTSGDYGRGIKEYEAGTTSKLSRLYTVNVNDNIVEETIDPAEGGSAISYDDEAEVEVPTEATSSTIRLIYTDLDAPSHPLPTGAALLRAFTVVAEDSATDTPVTSFDEPVTILVRYTSADLATLGITAQELKQSRYWNEDTGAWEEIGSTTTCDQCGVKVFEETQQVQITVDHLTEFAVGKITASGGGDENTVYLPLITR